MENNNNIKATEELTKLVAKGGLIVFIGSVIGKIIRFAFHVLLARVLGAASYGLYALGQSIVDVSANIGSLGNGKSMIRFGAVYLSAKDKPKLKGAAISFLFLLLIVSVFISIGIFIFAESISSYFFHNLKLAVVLRIFSIGIPFYTFSIGSIAVAIAFNKVKYKVIIQEICQPIAGIVSVSIMFFLLGWRLFGAAWGFVISSIVSSLVGFYLLRRIFPEIISKSKAVFQVKKILKYSLPIIFISFSYFLIFRVDRIMLGVFRPASEVGIYSIAANVAVYLLAFCEVFGTALLPVIAKLHYEDKKEQLKKIYNLVTFWGVWLAFMPCILLVTFNREVLSLFGSDFRNGGIALVILSCAFLFEAIPGQIKQLFQMSSKQNVEFFNALASIIINIGLNIVFIPRFGMAGAAAATLCSLFTVSVVRLIEAKSIFNFTIFSPRYKKFIIFVVVSLCFCVICSVMLGVTARALIVAAIFVIFGLSSYILKSSEDILVLSAIKRRLIGC